jgi:hypothetical protein
MADSRKNGKKTTVESGASCTATKYGSSQNNLMMGYVKNTGAIEKKSTCQS